jgi:predicted nucleotidyltransferase
MIRGPGWRPDVEARLGLDETRLIEFCERWRIANLELFGSVLRESFRSDSDVDVLVTFQPDAKWGLLQHAAMEEELAALLGRPVDLLTRRAVVRSTNPIRREAILAGAAPLLSVAGGLSIDAERVDD